MVTGQAVSASTSLMLSYYVEINKHWSMSKTCATLVTFSTVSLGFACRMLRLTANQYAMRDYKQFTFTGNR